MNKDSELRLDLNLPASVSFDFRGISTPESGPAKFNWFLEMEYLLSLLAAAAESGVPVWPLPELPRIGFIYIIRSDSDVAYVGQTAGVGLAAATKRWRAHLGAARRGSMACQAWIRSCLWCGAPLSFRILRACFVQDLDAAEKYFIQRAVAFGLLLTNHANVPTSMGAEWFAGMDK